MAPGPTRPGPPAAPIPIAGIPNKGIFAEAMAIRSFRRPEIADFFFSGKAARRTGWVGVAKVVTRKLDMLHYAQRVDDLRSPPANRLEALKGDLKGFFSIRVNDQWRVIFRWTGTGPEDVDVVDYHG